MSRAIFLLFTVKCRKRPMQLSFIPPIKSSLSGMSEAQRIDFIAACEGLISWRQYYEKWANNSGFSPQLLSKRLLVKRRK
jgi:hypothetical protein